MWQQCRKVEWKPANMSSPTPITTGTAQQAPQEPQSASQQQNRIAAEPSRGSQSDHPGYSAKRPSWTRGLSAEGKPARHTSIGTAPGAAVIHTDEASVQQEEKNVAAQSEPPSHIRCLKKSHQDIYTRLWKQLPDVPSHWREKALSTTERENAIDNIHIRRQLNNRSHKILTSGLADGNSAQAGLGAAHLLNLAQSNKSLDALRDALQTNRAVFGALRAKL
jgi:hypothetical protein